MTEIILGYMFDRSKTVLHQYGKMIESEAFFLKNSQNI
jgi:hypothetical protein